MRRTWLGILYHYGQVVTLCRGEERCAVMALIQPVTERSREQRVPTALGVDRQERFLYLGAMEQSMNTETVVEWQGRRFRVQRTHVVGAGICPYRWALLCPKDEVKV